MGTQERPVSMRRVRFFFFKGQHSDNAHANKQVCTSMVKLKHKHFLILDVIAVGSCTAFHQRESLLKLMMCQVLLP